MWVGGGGRGLLRWLLALVVALWSSSSSVCAYFITVDAHAEECFFDRVSSGTKLSLMFEVAEGGFLDIDVHVSTPPPRLFPLLVQSLPLNTGRGLLGSSICYVKFWSILTAPPLVIEPLLLDSVITTALCSPRNRLA